MQDTVERHGGLDVVMEKIVQWEQENPTSNGREMIDDFRLPGSRTWRHMGGPVTKGGRRTQVVNGHRKCQGLIEPTIPVFPQAARPAVSEREIGPGTGSAVFWHARGLEIAACPAKLADSGCRTPSNAMVASMSSWRRSSNGSRKTPPPTAAK